MRVLLVCLGNICRSPTAEAALREAAADAGLDLDVDSAGTGAWHVGDPPDRRMVAAGADAGLVIDGCARQVTRTDLYEYDLVLAMDRTNLADLRALAGGEPVRADIRLFLEFAGEPDRDVPDPYYGGADGFVEVVRLVRRAARGVVEAIASGRV